MRGAPYSSGDRVTVLLDDGPHDAVVSVVLESQAGDPARRWRLLCRDARTQRSLDVPLYCDDDGSGDRLAPAAPATCPGEVAVGGVTTDAAYVTACALGLAFSHHQGVEAVDALVRAAAARRETLEQARAALAGYHGQDPTVVRTAEALLVAAAEAVRPAATEPG